MSKIKDIISKLLEKFKNLSKAKKLAFCILSIGAILSIIFIVVFLNTTKYSILFKDMDPKDAQTVLAALNEKNIDYVVEDNTIKVPEENVAELRLELAPELTSGSNGYEILDDSSAFGMTDKERNLKYKMALEGELARTIESLPEVKDATVFLVMQEDSAFFEEAQPSQASVRLEFVPGEKVTQDQIQAIVSLLTGSVKNLDKENVKVIGVINGKTTDLSDGIENDNTDLASATDMQRQHEKNLEKEYENKILSLLTPIYGDGVKVAVDVDANFDAHEKTSTVYDPKPVVRSEEITKSTNSTDNGNGGASPVDNNMNNTIVNNGNGSQSSSEHETRNYEVGVTNEKTVTSPGEIKRISTSVTVDDANLSPAERDKINNIVAAATSYDAARGDIISIEGMDFNGFENGLEDETNQSEEAKKAKIFKYAAIGLGALILLLAIILVIRKVRKSKMEDIETEGVEGIDTIIDENITPKETLPPIEFEAENEKTHIEKEIKRYATEKPEQVAEIIKAWMAEDEG